MARDRRLSPSPSKVGHASTTYKPDADGDVDNSSGAKNGTGEGVYKRDPGCWGWIENVTYDYQDKNPSANGKSKETIEACDSFKGKNKDGEPNDDPEKALKNSRGGPGLNAGPNKGEAEESVPQVSLHTSHNYAPV